MTTTLTAYAPAVSEVRTEDKSMKIYTIIGDVNGVGKSSLTGVLNSERTDLGVIVDTDILNARYGGDKIKGGKEAVKIIADCL